VLGVYGGHVRDRRRPTGKNHVSGSNLPISVGREAMQIDWMTGAEISEAIPPAYARYVAEAFLAQHALEPILQAQRGLADSAKPIAAHDADDQRRNIMNQHLAELAADYVPAAHDLSNYFSENGDSFRFTADGHTVEISFDEELGWRIIADGVTVKEADEEDDFRASAFEEAWLALSRLTHPNCEAEAKELFDKISLDLFQKTHRASLI
jgi:hypothetical protein